MKKGENSRGRDYINKFLEECLGNGLSTMDQIVWDRIRIRP